MGNLRSVSKALERVGGDVVVTTDPEIAASADKIVLPGVGAFQKAISSLAAEGMDDAVRQAVAAGKPFLGICLGLQLLFEKSFEDGEHDGLGILPGKVVRFESDPERHDLKIPQIGWNRVDMRPQIPHFDRIPSGSFFYFVHSYYVVSGNASCIAGETEYLGRFTSAVCRDNVFACQFHPEKSQKWGLKLLENFVRL